MLVPTGGCLNVGRPTCDTLRFGTRVTWGSFGGKVVDERITTFASCSNRGHGVVDHEALRNGGRRNLRVLVKFAVS